MDIKERFGLKLKNLRQQKGLSQEAFANLSEIDRAHFPDIEKEKRNISITIMEKIAKALTREWTRTLRSIREKYRMNISWLRSTKENPSGAYIYQP